MSGPPAEGRVEEIYVYPERRGPARECGEVIAVSGVGLTGDHRRNPSRAVTLLASEAWEEAMALMGADLPPRARRANLVVRGLDLGSLVGRRLRIGGAEISTLYSKEPSFPRQIRPFWLSYRGRATGPLGQWRPADVVARAGPRLQDPHRRDRGIARGAAPNRARIAAGVHAPRN